MKIISKLLLLLLLTVPSWAAAGSKLSPATRLFLQSQRVAKHAPSVQPATVSMFVSGGNGLERAIEQASGHVDSRFSDFVTATVPVSAIETLAQSSAVRQIDVSSRVHLLCDSARSVTHVSQVLAGTGLPQAYDGSGVVLGVIDTGIDFNHPAFRKADGTTRIVKVYLPDDTTGTSPVIDGTTLPGSLYGESQVAHLTCDTPNGTHGTHVAGIAAGTLCGKYGGMAPGAEIFAVGLGTNLSEVNVVNACYLIAHYAQSVGKPCVINMSLGNHDGPHDGTGFMARAFDEVTQIGHTTIVLAAGNEADTKLYAHKSLADGQPLNTLLDNTSRKLETQVNAWNQDTAAISASVLVVNVSTKQIVYQSPYFVGDTLLDFSGVSELSQYATGTVIIEHGQNEISGKTNMFFDISTQVTSSDYKLALSISGNSNADVHMWEYSGTAEFKNYDIPGFIAGSNVCSISDMATGSTTISVGAFVSKNLLRDSVGVVIRRSTFSLGSVCDYSGFGTDLAGQVHPHVIAPGEFLASAVNSYAVSSSRIQQIVVDGRKYCWDAFRGTSMAAPCVSGIVALVLQANPNLNGAQVRQLLQSTAIRDSYVLDDSAQCGGGKVDALAAVQAGIASAAPSVQATTVQAYATPAGITVAGAAARVDIYSLTGQLVLSLVLAQQGGTVSLAGLSDGVYVAKVTGRGSDVTLKVLKR